jgi:hypothetical protein
MVFITKGDGLSTKYFSRLRDEGRTISQARNGASELAEKEFNTRILPFISSVEKPPTNIIFLRGMSL